MRNIHKFLLFNVRKLFYNLDEIGEFLITPHFDIIALAETWLSSDMYEIEIRLSNYTWFCADHSERFEVGMTFCIKSNPKIQCFKMSCDLHCSMEPTGAW